MVHMSQAESKMAAVYIPYPAMFCTIGDNCSPGMILITLIYLSFLVSAGSCSCYRRVIISSKGHVFNAALENSWSSTSLNVCISILQIQTLNNRVVKINLVVIYICHNPLPCEFEHGSIPLDSIATWTHRNLIHLYILNPLIIDIITHKHMISYGKLLWLFHLYIHLSDGSIFCRDRRALVFLDSLYLFSEHYQSPLLSTCRIDNSPLALSAKNDKTFIQMYCTTYIIYALLQQDRSLLTHTINCPLNKFCCI